MQTAMEPIKGWAAIEPIKGWAVSIALQQRRLRADGATGTYSGVGDMCSGGAEVLYQDLRSKKANIE